MKKQIAIVAALMLMLLGVPLALAQQKDVTVTEQPETYTLDNGIVVAMVAKASGDLVSLKYNGLEMLATRLDAQGQPDLKLDPPGENVNGLNRGMTDHQYAFWSHDAAGQRGTDPATARITIDPKSNGGERAEVAVKGISNGRLMGTGPGANGGNFISDIEIRWALSRGESGIYTYCAFEHKPEYAASSITEARFCAKLNEFFDWLSAGDKYNKPYPREQERGEDKYTYTTVQSTNPAFGWSSTTKKVGFYCINPSMEYMSGGPTKPEFLGHRDTNPVAAPCVLNYWRSSHYGGADVTVGQGEHWDKVIGPFMLYVNSGADSAAMYDDAKAQAAKEQAKWPYAWVSGVDYPNKAERSTVSGRLILDDQQMPLAALKNLEVGLTHAAYTPPPVPFTAGRGRGGPATGPAFAGANGGRRGPATGPGARGPLARGRGNAPTTGPAGGFPRLARVIDWQNDAKYYQFWARGNDDGTFAIPNVRAGTYTLRAFADGVLGELAQADVTVEAGKPLDLGKIDWKPVRKGKQVWDIGIPNRNGSEFFKGDEYAVMDISLQYPKLFPNDITYTIGKSDFRKDWFFQQVPHNVDPNARAVPFYGVRGEPGKATPYIIQFDMAQAPKGKATLRLAICGGAPRSIDVSVNGQSAGEVTRLIGDGVLTRHQIQGMWYEREVAFDAGMLKQGPNTLTLTVPAGPVGDGVIYDYLRLELDESASASPAPAQ